MTTTANPVVPDPAVEVGAVIHALMFRQRVTITAMGEALGIQHSTMGRKLRGQTAITVPELFTIARVLGITPDEIVLRACRDSNPKPSDP